MFFLRKIKSKIYNRLYVSYYKYIKRDIRCELLILDDIFPQEISAFRIVEYSCYLDQFDSHVLSTGASFSLVKESRTFNEVRNLYYAKMKSHIGRITQYNSLLNVQAKVAYFMFLNNGKTFLNFIEKNKLPFIFTLYPGGGLMLNQESTNASLKHIFTSKYFRYVIVTQKHVIDYLKLNNLCDEAKIKFIYGSPGNINQNTKLIELKKYFPENKPTLDICFVAGKYMPEGRDKGYDTFIEVAKKLNRIHKNIRFHVVGGFDKYDIDISDIEEYIYFYGFLKTKQLAEFYINMDIILSPNISNTLHEGAFDGFPLGCVQEAGGLNVLMACYDDLKQNLVFEDEKDMIILDQDIDFIVNEILYLYNNPKIMYDIAQNGRKKLLDLVSYEAQLLPRINLIKSLL